MKCQKCRYHTGCLPTMLDHIATCTVEEFTSFSPLDAEMHCVCGFSSSEGNALARHLVNCERRSAYASVEAAQDNTVKRNMLDMLGLVRRDDEENDENADETGEDSTLNKSNQEGGDAAATSAEGGEFSAEQQQQQQSTDANAMDTMEATDQYSTQLSLDDLAPPSVLRPAENQEIDIDRTPIVEEYQSLATPQVMDSQGNEWQGNM
jgi:pogo transposable element with ZNF domain